MKLGADNSVQASPSNIANLARQSRATGASPDSAEKTAKPATPTRPGPAGAGVPVSVSSLARTLAQPATDSGADIDTKKVEEVRNAISNGTFKVNAGAIADKMLAGAQELLRSRRN